MAVFCLSAHPRLGGCIGRPAGPWLRQVTARAASMAVASQMLELADTITKGAGRAKTDLENAKEAEEEGGLP
jgi:hypothetical protein